MGAGHLYVGKIARGIVLILFSILTGLLLPLFMIGLIAGGGFGVLSILVIMLRLGVWVWQTYDAYMLVKTYNAAVDSTGKPPW